MELKDAYLTLHNASGIEVGDTVRVLRKAKSYEMGWSNSWQVEMDGFIGGTFEVRSDSKAMGIELRRLGYSYNLGFPFFCLEIVKKAAKVKPLSGKIVKVELDGVSYEAKIL